MAAKRRRLLHCQTPKPIDRSKTYLEAFVAYTAGECHLAENTVAAYRRDLEHFFTWLQRRGIPELTIRDLADYVAWLHARELAPASITRHIVSLKVFFRYLQLEGVMTANLAELLGSQKLWERVPKVLSPQQIDRLFAAPGRSDPHWRRDRALLELLYATGCRASELSNLRLPDMHLDEGFCICHGKGDKERMVPLGVRSVEAVRAYLEHERPGLAARAARRPTGSCSPLAAGACGGSGFGNCLSAMPSASARRRRSARTPCATVSPPICWPAAPISAKSKKCSATPASPPRKSTPTSTPRG